MMERYIGLIIVVVIIAAICGGVAWNNLTNKKVMKISPYYNSIVKLNSETKFNDIAKPDFIKTFYLKSKRTFDVFDVSKNATNYMKENSSYFQDQICRVEQNQELKREYDRAISAIPHTSDVLVAKQAKISLKSFVKREERLAQKIILHPCVDYQLTIDYQYTSPAGRNHYERTAKYSLTEIKAVVGAKILDDKKPNNSGKKICQRAIFQAPITNKPEVSIDDIEDMDE
jgi:hypothetical protein